MRVTQEFYPYNSRRYSPPWIAKVVSWPIGKPAKLVFGHTTHVTAEIDAEPGDVVRWRDTRARVRLREESPWGIVQADGSILESDAKTCRQHYLDTQAAKVAA